VTPDDYCTHGLLELFSDEKKLLAINVSLEVSEYDSEWRPFDIEAFIDGDWINGFRHLKELIEKSEELEEYERVEDPKKVQELKDNFGIE